jgi:hypothetical protein
VKTLALSLALVGLLHASARAEVDSTCVSCHAEEEDEELSAPVEEWRRSVHGAAEVSCDSCHGGNPFEEDAELSMDEDKAGYLGEPGWSEVPGFCGACHEEIQDAYLEGTLGQRMAQGERVAVCSTCHEAHAVHPPVPREILKEERCGECASFLPLIASLEDGFTRVDRELSPLRDWIDTALADRELGGLHHEAILRIHSYDRPRIEEIAGRAKHRLQEISADTAALREQARFRRLLGAGIVGALLVAGFLGDRLSATFRRKESDE